MFGFEAREAVVAGEEACTGGGGCQVGVELASEQGFGFAEAFGEGDLTWADVVAAAAFDAVEQAVTSELVAVEGLQVPVQLLGQQERGAHVRAVAAANAGHLGAAGLQVERGGGDDAVGGLHDGHLVVR